MIPFLKVVYSTWCNEEASTLLFYLCSGVSMMCIGTGHCGVVDLHKLVHRIWAGVLHMHVYLCLVLVVVFFCYYVHFQVLFVEPASSVPFVFT